MMRLKVEKLDAADRWRGCLDPIQFLPHLVGQFFQTLSRRSFDDRILAEFVCWAGCRLSRVHVSAVGDARWLHDPALSQCPWTPVPRRRQPQPMNPADYRIPASLVRKTRCYHAGGLALRVEFPEHFVVVCSPERHRLIP